MNLVNIEPIVMIKAITIKTKPTIRKIMLKCSNLISISFNFFDILSRNFTYLPPPAHAHAQPAQAHAQAHAQPPPL